MLTCPMDRAVLEQLLADGEMRISDCETRVERQQELVAELVRDGRDTRQAVQILRDLEAYLGLHTGRRDQLRKELGLIGPACLGAWAGLLRHFPRARSTGCRCPQVRPRV